MKFFKPEDFHHHEFVKTSFAADQANAKLEREGKVVYGIPHGSSQEFEEPWIACDINRYPGMTRKALLINIEKIEKCTHPLEKLHWPLRGLKTMLDNQNDTELESLQKFYLNCECGARVKPKEFEEVK